MLSAPALYITYKSFLEDLSLRQFLKGNTPLSIVTWCNKSKWLVVHPLYVFVGIFEQHKMTGVGGGGGGCARGPH